MISANRSKSTMSECDTDINTVVIHRLFHVILSSNICIFEYLTIKDLSSFDKACSNHAIRKSWLSCPKHLENQLVNISNDDQINYVVNRNLHLSVLAIMDEKQTVTDENFKLLIKQCRFLTKFRLEKNKSISFGSFKALVQNLNGQLYTLCIDSCDCINNENLELIGQKCPQLETFSLFSCPYADICGLEDMVKYCHQLRVLFIRNYYDNSNSSSDIVHKEDTRNLFTVLGNNCPYLINICLKGYILNSNEFEVFTSNCKYIKSMGFYTCNGLNDIMLKAIGNGSKVLEKFCYGECGNHTIFDVSSSGFRSFFNGCKKLKILTSDAQFPMVRDEAFQSLSITCPILERFRLDCGPLSDQTLMQFGRISNLKRLYFFTENSFTDDGILSLLNGGTIANLSDVSDEDAIEIRQSPRANNTIKENEHQDMIIQTPRSSITRRPSRKMTGLFHPLETLSLRIDGFNITEKSIYHIANYCTNLKDIYIVDENRTVQDEAIKYLLSKAKKLSSITGNDSFNMNRNNFPMINRSFISFLYDNIIEFFVMVLLVLSIVFLGIYVYQLAYC